MLGILLIVAVTTSALACFAAKSSGDADQGRTYGYLRVSTDRQALSPQVQRDTIDRAAKNLGRSIDDWFQDAPTQNPDGSWNDAQSGKVPLAERNAGKELCAASRGATSSSSPRSIGPSADSPTAC